MYTFTVPTVESRSSAELSITSSVPAELELVNRTTVFSGIFCCQTFTTRTLTALMNSGMKLARGWPAAGDSGAVAASRHAADDKVTAAAPAAIRPRLIEDRRVERRISNPSQNRVGRRCDREHESSGAVCRSTCDQKKHG